MAKQKILYEQIMENILSLPKDRYISRAVLYKYYREGIFLYHPCLIYRCVSSIKELRKITNTDKIKARYTDYMTKENAKKRINKRIKTITKWDKEKITNGLISLSKKYGEINLKELPSLLKKEHLCGKDIIRKHFGKVTTAFKELNLPFRCLHYMDKEKVIRQISDIKKQNGRICKCDINKIYHKQGLLPTAGALRKTFGSLDELAKQANIEFDEAEGGLRPNIGRHEKEILEQVELLKDIKLIPQYRVGLFSIDGYDPLNNIAYEVDEVCHLESIDKDKYRENIIKQKIGCKFIRIPEQEVLNNPDSLSNIIAQSD